MTQLGNLIDRSFTRDYRRLLMFFQECDSKGAVFREVEKMLVSRAWFRLTPTLALAPLSATIG